jgi:hypothetical protein
MSLRDDLKALSVVLPPSERVFSGELADLTGALINYLEHGPDLLEVAKQGAAEVQDFYHEKIAEYAEKAGLPAPVRGAIAGPLATPTAAHDAKMEALIAQVEKMSAIISKLTSATEEQG